MNPDDRMEATVDDVTGIGVEVERTVPVPPAAMWAVISDVTRIGEWSPECVAAEWLEGAGPKVGARFVGHNRYPGGFTASVTCVVTEAEQPHAFAWQVLDEAGEPYGTWRYELRPAGGSGRTLVRQSFVHGPGDSGLRVGARKAGRAAADGRLAELRRNMIITIDAMAAAAR